MYIFIPSKLLQEKNVGLQEYSKESTYFNRKIQCQMIAEMNT